MTLKPNVNMNGERYYTIRRLTRDLNITSRALRFYETKGMLHPIRRGPTRLFSIDDVSKLRLILLGKRAGFPLSEIKEMLDLRDQEDGEAVQRRVTLARGREQLKVLKRRKDELASAINELERRCHHIEHVQRRKGDLQEATDRN